MTADFDALYQQADPFGYAHRWYERRKRELLMAMLPRPRFGRAWELGCSTGELTRLLAARCEHITGTDVSAGAIAQARAVGPLPNLSFECSRQPQQWPEGRFDLIVFSEVGYYLDEAALRLTAQQLAGSLEEGGGLIACHWRRPFDGRQHSAEHIHQQLSDALGSAPAHDYRDADMLMQAWWPGPSIAEREGLA